MRGGRRRRCPTRAAEDAGDLEGALIEGKVDAQQADGDRAARGFDIARRADVGVPDVQLGDELGDDEGDVLAVDGIVHELGVTLAERLPVVAVHGGLVEVVAHEAVDVGHDLLPLIARVDGGAHAFGGDGLGLSAARGRVDDDHVSAAAEDEQLLAVAREFEAAALGDGLLGAFFVVEVEDADGGGLVHAGGRAADVEQLVVVRDGKRAEAAEGMGSCTARDSKPSRSILRGFLSSSFLGSSFLASASAAGWALLVRLAVMGPD